MSYLKLICRRVIESRLGKGIVALLIYLFITCLLLISIEILARVVTDMDWISYYHPVHIQSLIDPSRDKEDWRLTHIFKDEFLESDARLLWKPKPNMWKYNHDGYVGSKTASALNRNKCIFLALGDSNTQGIEETSWPEELDTLFIKEQIASRVMNAGVVGYSSNQGLWRFRQETDRVHPSHVFVSFGWNDLAPSMGVRDEDFEEYYFPQLDVLNNVRLYLIIKKMVARPNLSIGYRPRVSIEEYRHNLETIIQEGKKREIEIILVTRPFNTSDMDYWSTLSSESGGWRVQVPAYNDEVRAISTEQSVALLDLDKYLTRASFIDFLDDSHLTKKGNQDAAREALRVISERFRDCY